MDRQTTKKIDGAAPWLGLAGRLILGAVFVGSGTLKAAGPVEEFAVVIAGYGILPDSMNATAAALIPWFEVFAGLSLLAGYFTKQAAAASGALSLCFILALLSVKLRGYELPNCGCFGNAVHLSMWQALAMDAVLVACAAAAFKAGAARLSLDNWVNEGL